MADAFDAGSTKIDEQRKALLVAMAQAGTAGRQAVEAARVQAAQQRAAAVQAALADANRRGAPPELAAQLDQTIGAPYDRAAADLSASAASREAEMAQRQASSEAYLGEAQAAIPTLRARSERQLAALQAKAELAAADNDLRRQVAELGLQRGQLGLERDTTLGELSLQKAQLGLESQTASGQLALARAQLGLDTAGVNLTAAQARAAAGGRSGDGSLSDSELAKRLVGAARVAAEADQAQLAPPSSFGGARQIEQRAIARDRAAMTEADRARRIGVGAGLDPSRVYGVVPNPKPAKAAKDPDASLARKIGVSDLGAIRKTPAYQAAVETVQVGLQGGMSFNDFKRFLNTDPQFRNRPKTVALVLEEYKARFPSNQPPGL